MIVINEDGLDKFTTELAEKISEKMEKLLTDKAMDQNDWITEEEARKILPLKSKTSWQKMRDRGYIHFTQMGRKILYSRKSIFAFLEKNKVGLKSLD